MRKLIPEAIPGNSVADLITAKANYAKLDDSSLAGSDSAEQHRGASAASGRSRDRQRSVELTYSRLGKLYTVHAPHAVLACWNMVIPYICAELPEKQKAGSALRGESSVALHQRRNPELDVVSETRR